MGDGPCFRDFACSEVCKSYKLCNIKILILWVICMIWYRLLINWDQYYREHRLHLESTKWHILYKKINLLWRLGGKNRLGAREQGLISEKCRYSVTAERLLACRSMERRETVVTESAITTPKMTAVCLKKKLLYTNQTQPHSNHLLSEQPKLNVGLKDVLIPCIDGSWPPSYRSVSPPCWKVRADDKWQAVSWNVNGDRKKL